MANLLVFDQKGIYCPIAKVYIDPWKPVKKALITHGHADHARWGHDAYLCVESASPVMRYRLGAVTIQHTQYNKPFRINGVQFSFHPAGHVVGSAQIRVEYKGEVWVVSGDYKLENDGISEGFEPVKCHVFITESTFGLPIYRWNTQQSVMHDINEWWRQSQEQGKTCMISAYSLGKAQRILANIDTGIGPVYTHGSIENVNEIIRKQGFPLPKTLKFHNQIDKNALRKALIIAPPSAFGSHWARKFDGLSTAIASGWMALRGARRRRGADRGFVLSDHADWIGLNQAIKETGAEKIYVTHGYTETFSKWLVEQGYDACPVKTEFNGEALDESLQLEDEPIE